MTTHHDHHEGFSPAGGPGRGFGRHPHPHRGHDEAGHGHAHRRGHGRGGRPGHDGMGFGPEGPFGPGGPGGGRGPGPFGPFGPGGFGEFAGFGGPGGGPGRGGRGGRRRRRGDVRLGILLLLAEGPQNGYGLIRELAERSDGAWKPSSGAVYPALSQLEDEGLVEPDEAAGRKHYRLSDAGRAEVDSLDRARPPWEEASADAADERGGSHELWKAFGEVAMAARAVAQVGEPSAVDRATAELVALRRTLYGILADGDGDGAGATEAGTAEAE